VKGNTGRTRGAKEGRVRERGERVRERKGKEREEMGQEIGPPMF
jgi:hypothetical protein